MTGTAIAGIFCPPLLIGTLAAKITVDETLGRNVDELRGTVSRIRGDIHSAENRLKESEQDYNKSSSEYDHAQLKLAQLTAKVNRFNAYVANAKKRITEIQELIDVFAKAIPLVGDLKVSAEVNYLIQNMIT